MEKEQVRTVPAREMTYPDVVTIDGLEKCPFCGGDAEMRAEDFLASKTNRMVYVKCTKCVSIGKKFFTGKTLEVAGYPSRIVTLEEAKENAKKAWNMRKTDGKGQNADFYISGIKESLPSITDEWLLQHIYNCVVDVPMRGGVVR